MPRSLPIGAAFHAFGASSWRYRLNCDAPTVKMHKITVWTKRKLLPRWITTATRGPPLVAFTSDSEIPNCSTILWWHPRCFTFIDLVISPILSNTDINHYQSSMTFDVLCLFSYQSLNSQSHWCSPTFMVGHSGHCACPKSSGLNAWSEPPHGANEHSDDFFPTYHSLAI